MLTFGEYSQAWDFRNTVAGQLQVDAYYNISKDPNAGNSSPLAVRVNQVGFPDTTHHTVKQGCKCAHLTALSANAVTACFAALSKEMKLFLCCFSYTSMQVQTANACQRSSIQVL